MSDSGDSFLTSLLAGVGLAGVGGVSSMWGRLTKRCNDEPLPSREGQRIDLPADWPEEARKADTKLLLLSRTSSYGMYFAAPVTTEAGNSTWATVILYFDHEEQAGQVRRAALRGLREDVQQAAVAGVWLRWKELPSNCCLAARMTTRETPREPFLWPAEILDAGGELPTPRSVCCDAHLDLFNEMANGMANEKHSEKDEQEGEQPATPAMFACGHVGP